MRWKFKIWDGFKPAVLKKGYQIGSKKRGKRGDSPVFEIERWNWFGISETTQNLSLLKQILISSFHRGDQRKKTTGESPLLSGFIFSIWYPF